MLAGRQVNFFFNLSYTTCSIVKTLSRVHISCCINDGKPFISSSSCRPISVLLKNIFLKVVDNKILV